MYKPEMLVYRLNKLWQIKTNEIIRNDFKRTKTSAIKIRYGNRSYIRLVDTRFLKRLDSN